jgi:hypothetical protein
MLPPKQFRGRKYDTEEVQIICLYRPVLGAGVSSADIATSWRAKVQLPAWTRDFSVPYGMGNNRE